MVALEQELKQVFPVGPINKLPFNAVFFADQSSEP